MSDLSWLKDATPVRTKFQKATRGRQPGTNPMEQHVINSYSSPEPLALEVPAEAAHTVERAIRRAAKVAGVRDWKMSVQVGRVNPNSDEFTPDDLIPLRDLPGLKEGDVWITFKAEDKPKEDSAKKAPAAEEAAPEDPFQESAPAEAPEAPEAPAAALADPFASMPAGDAPESAEDAPRRGRFTRQSVIK